MLSEDSIMQPGRGLFDAPEGRIKIVDDGAGNRTLEKTSFTQALFDFGSKEQIKLTPNSDGLLFVPQQVRGKFPLIWTPNKEYTGDTVRIAAETDDLKGAGRLCAEARYEPRQVARPVRAAGNRGD